MKLKLIFFLLSSVFCIAINGQDSGLNLEQKKAVPQLINTIKTKNKQKIADLIYQYPIGREYPSKNIKSKSELIQRFDEIFDNYFLDHIWKDYEKLI
jgi:hypothetical protein